MQDVLKQIASILYHDKKINTYKFALIRSLADVAVGYEFENDNENVYIPLKNLAYKWVAYYWVFMSDGDKEGVFQSQQHYGVQDVTFRESLEKLKTNHRELGLACDFITDGYFYSDEGNAKLSDAQSGVLKTVISDIKRGLNQPIRYAKGGGEHSFFQKERNHIVVRKEIFQSIRQHSLYIEALAVSEWAKWIGQQSLSGLTAGEAFSMMTKLPEGRQSIQKYRKIFKGCDLVCPYSGRRLQDIDQDRFELDHVIPIAVYPINDLWNLLPVFGKCNSGSGGKFDKIPAKEVLYGSVRIIGDIYEYYLDTDYSRLFQSQYKLRLVADTFGNKDWLANRAVAFMDSVAESRSVMRWNPQMFTT